MLNQASLKQLKKEWSKRIGNQSGIIYRYSQKELIESFIEDLRKIYQINSPKITDYPAKQLKLG